MLPRLDFKSSDLTWGIKGGNWRGRFSVNPESGLIYLQNGVDKDSGRSTLDFEDTSLPVNPLSLPYFRLMVSLTDSQGMQGTGFVEITIFDVNESPEFQSHAFYVDENLLNGVVGQLVAYDDDMEHLPTGKLKFKAVLIMKLLFFSKGCFNARKEGCPAWKLDNNIQSVFSVGNQGEILLKNSLDYEGGRNVFQIIVVAEDGGKLSDRAEVVILLNDLNEAPTMNNAIRYIQENSPSHTKIGEPIFAYEPDIFARLWVIADFGLSAFKAFAASGNNLTKSLWRSSVFRTASTDFFVP
jgi:hypothetical protein